MTLAYEPWATAIGNTFPVGRLRPSYYDVQQCVARVSHYPLRIVHCAAMHPVCQKLSTCWY